MSIIKSVGIDAGELKKIVDFYNVVLPSDYMDFLTRENGMIIGSGSYCTIPFSKVDDGQIDFQELFGIGTVSPLLDLFKVNEYRDEITELANPLIIGADPGGNFFVMNCKFNDEAIYYWDRGHIHYNDFPDHPEQDGQGNIYKLYDSFASFYKAILTYVEGDKNVEISKL